MLYNFAVLRFMRSTRTTIWALAMVLVVTIGSSHYGHAQTLHVLHTFTGTDGQEPVTGLTMDAAGNLYGTTYYGGSKGAGTVFKMTRRNGSWTFSPLYSFKGGDDGVSPGGRVVIGPNGTLYGTTAQGGGTGCYGMGCGTVFNLRPPAQSCKTAICPWTETVLHRFGDVGSGDGIGPVGDLVFDQAGNLYGATAAGGSDSNGAIYELSPAGGGWTESIIFSFKTSGGTVPAGGVIFDNAGNLYGTTNQGGDHQLGTAYQLKPSGSGWTQTVLHSFKDPSDGYYTADLAFDSLGNLYGATFDGGDNGGGTVYQLAPSGGSWALNVLQSFSGQGFGGQLGGSVLVDAARNVYGVTVYGGSGDAGRVFKLTPSGGGWIYTNLHDFPVPGSDGYYPNGSLVMDASGTLYGTTAVGGTGNPGYGVVFEITP